jgi:alanine racemase
MLIKLEITQRNFDTILAALWQVKLQASAHPAGGYNSPMYVEVDNLMHQIGSQRDKQVWRLPLSAFLGGE